MTQRLAVIGTLLLDRIKKYPLYNTTVPLSILQYQVCRSVVRFLAVTWYLADVRTYATGLHP